MALVTHNAAAAAMHDASVWRKKLTNSQYIILLPNTHLENLVDNRKIEIENNSKKINCLNINAYSHRKTAKL